jgi:putative DNA primase/helicase
MIELNKEGVAAEMKQSRRWVRWALCDVQDGDKLRKEMKPPFQANGKPAKHNDSSTWGTYEEVLAAHEANVPLELSSTIAKDHGVRGIGLVIGPPFFGIDLDDCRDAATGALTPEAEEWVEELNTLTEISPSGEGLHLWCHGEPPYPEGHRKDGREIYSTNRYLTVTGHVLTGRAEIRRFQKDEVKRWYDRVKNGTTKVTPCGDSKLNDHMTRTDFPDASQAVMSLLTQLMYKHDGDAAKVEAEFRNSALFNETHWKEKWRRLRASQLKKAREYFDSHPRTTEESRSLITGWLHDVKEKPLMYLWKPVFPLGHITTFAGRSSEGKSPVTIDLIARATRGGAWPDGTPNTLGPKKAILMNIEDGLEDMIAPRFRLAGGDPESVCTVRGVRVQKKDSFHDGLLALDKDIHLLCDLARSIENLGIIVIDPITQYCGKAKMNADDEIRQVLGPLLPLAEELQIAIVLVAHFNKNGNTTDPLARVQGGNAFVGMARSVYVFSEDKSKDKYAHILSPARSKETSYLYHTEQVSQEIDGVTSDVIRVVWDGVSETSAESAIEEAKVSKKEITLNQKAAVELKNFLKAGKRDSVTCQAFLKAAGFRVEDLDWQRVRKYAGVKASQEGGKSWWFLPTAANLFEKPKGRDDDAPSY